MLAIAFLVCLSSADILPITIEYEKVGDGTKLIAEVDGMLAGVPKDPTIFFFDSEERSISTHDGTCFIPTKLGIRGSSDADCSGWDIKDDKILTWSNSLTFYECEQNSKLAMTAKNNIQIQDKGCSEIMLVVAKFGERSVTEPQENYPDLPTIVIMLVPLPVIVLLLLWIKLR
ncbi:uncharacterized protein J8A68_004867 [[Candida] subhashii]|uniref:Uncharacterized protein n=1 Tax=[Candida] subhashii TaxID=561895 RepID=A0A8J5QGA9_9ASCO|nr:uncharacterized protein J8A68_004867 [[Candida] subhashii]KAG7661599.1 hypothetical protein J8A68_004867 [[Candida] subhashii]